MPKEDDGVGFRPVWDISMALFSNYGGILEPGYLYEVNICITSIIKKKASKHSYVEDWSRIVGLEENTVG